MPNIKSEFPLGEIVATSGVADLMEKNTLFKGFCIDRLIKHATKDWGDLNNEDKELNNQSSGTNWNKTRTLAPKYYDIYAYGDSSDDNNAMLRTRYGDATGEITIDNNKKKTTWNNDNEISFVNKDNSWFIRGGDATETPGMYNYKSTKGEAKNTIGFRISLA